ncbi:hypothetical protein D3C73_1545350 [compost metagenome]
MDWGQSFNAINVTHQFSPVVIGQWPLRRFHYSCKSLLHFLSRDLKDLFRHRLNFQKKFVSEVFPEVYLLEVAQLMH